MSFRIGHGFDVHAFGPGDRVVLGGVSIPHHQGVRAHSDGDVVLHALCDALLGGAALGDIGVHFPDSDPAWKDCDSRELLRRVRELVVGEGLDVCNVDVTLVCEAPRVGAHRQAMRENIAAVLALPVSAVNVKATTTEGLGYLGRHEGIAAHAVALLQPR